MARLKYNGLTATLGAALTSGDTTITFAAPLTSAAGAVPTIAGSDVIPLTILSSTGAVSEIVSLTAYTSGATTGTVTRAQESTTAAAHTSGADVVHSATVADFATGGGTAGAMTLISAQTVTTAAADINFTSIPGTYRDLIIEGKMRSNRASTINDNLAIRVGTGGTIDTGATNYRSSVQVQGPTSLTQDTNSTGTLYFKVAENAFPGATADADAWGCLRATILDYADATYWRQIEAMTSATLTTAAFYRNLLNGHWKNKAGAIDCIRLTALNGQFITGTSFRLYGRT